MLTVARHQNSSPEAEKCESSALRSSAKVSSQVGRSSGWYERGFKSVFDALHCITERSPSVQLPGGSAASVSLTAFSSASHSSSALSTHSLGGDYRSFGGPRHIIMALIARPLRLFRVATTIHQRGGCPRLQVERACRKAAVDFHPSPSARSFASTAYSSAGAVPETARNEHQHPGPESSAENEWCSIHVSAIAI